MCREGGEGDRQTYSEKRHMGRQTETFTKTPAELKYLGQHYIKKFPLHAIFFKSLTFVTHTDIELLRVVGS